MNSLPESTSPTNNEVTQVPEGGETRARSEAACVPQSPTATTARDLQRAVRQADSWQDLSTVLDRSQVLFEQGQLSREEAENLAVLAAQEAHCLPETGEDDQPIKSAEVVLDDAPAAPDTCFCCGKAHWWTTDGGRHVCGICHPDPRAFDGDGDD